MQTLRLSADRGKRHRAYWHSCMKDQPCDTSAADVAPTELHRCPAPDELTSVSKPPSCTDSHIVRLPIPAMVKNTFDT